MDEQVLENSSAQNENNAVDPVRFQAKFDLWERKLLDLSTRNSLLNLRIKGSAIPLFVPKCSDIEDLIAQEKSFSIIARGDGEEEIEEETQEEKPEEVENKAETPVQESVPEIEAAAQAVPAPGADTAVGADNPVETDNPADKDAEADNHAAADHPAETDKSVEGDKESSKSAKKIKGVPAKDYSIEDLADITEFKEFIDKKYAKGVLVSSLTNAALDKNIKTLYRGAKTSMEENGANTLFLACGFLKWYEKDRKDPCYAPLLLIPVELVKKFGIKYTMRRRDEDVQFNVTVSEKLRQDFKIEFDEFSKDLPADEHGVNVNEIFKQVSEVVKALKGWEVIESCVLGLFSFSQFVMWNDMHSHRDSIAKNKIVKSLINGQLEWQSEDMASIGKVPEDDVFLPIVADSSQLAAIRRAAQDDGASFVLHGPPGTGKSQTITSIIANCLANNKKVLFAAEKKAALDVVYKRLEKIGIAPFCLELHSNKVRKSYVLDQLKTASEVRLNAKVDGDYDKALADIASKRKELDKYVDELHVRRDCGMSLYELINIYASNQNAVDAGAFDEGFVDGLSAERIKETETALGELVASSGHLEGKLPFVKATSYSQDAKNKLTALADGFLTAYDELAASINNFERLVAANNCRVACDPGTVGRIAGLNACGLAILKLKDLNLPKGIICCDDTESTYLVLRDTVISCKDAVAKRDALLAAWQPGFLDLDGAMILGELMTAKAKNALMRGMAENNVYKKVRAYDLKGNRKEVLEQDLRLLVDYKNSVQIAMTSVTASRSCLGELYNPAAQFPGFDLAYVETLNENAHAAFSEFAVFDPSGSLRKLIGSGDTSVIDITNDFSRKASAYKAAYDALKDTYGLENGAFEPYADLLDTKKRLAETLKADSDYLRDRMQFNLMASRCSEYKVSNLVKGYDNGTVSGQDIISSFRKGYSVQLISSIIDGSEVLRTFSGLVFEKKIDELSKVNDEFEKITRQEIYLRIAGLYQSSNVKPKEGSKLSILNKAISSGGRGVSIRTLFTQIGEDLILKLCPCVLMSPLSCAQYLDPDKCGMFDVVIFDEASQLPTCKAIGVIARGKEAVIVGDPKQMPPTSFFTEQVSDEDDFETEDLESILDDCLAVNMPQMFLAWHYRSRHESLITFSNKSFYEGRLYTFPSPDDRESKVTMVDCGGSFDSGKTRTNKTEAQAVIDEIVKRAHDPVLSKYSVGVVTFNIQQQSLIEDLLDEAASKDPELEKWAFGSEEPVFIKNLENVQGDERDVILFSVGYGKDETGKLIMNFGPLNRDGGWRRLNVAVTRSRIEMKVFSSISPEEIRISETSSEGVKAFKRFLQYAGGSTVWDQDIAQTGNSSDNSGTPIIDRNAAYTGIADDICARFNAAGYDTDKGVGKSGFKIDIGVVSPEKDGTYCLGILLDGPVYAASGTTTSREVSQMSMLKGFGWNVVRIWSLEWWENPDKVFAKLVELVNEANKEKKSAEAAVAESTTDTEPVETIAEDTEVVPEDAGQGPKVVIYGADADETSEETGESEDVSGDLTQKKTADVEPAVDDVCPAVVCYPSDVAVRQMSEGEFCFKSNENTEYLKQKILEIIEQQAPICEEELAKELAGLAGITKMSAAVKARCAYLIKSVQSKTQPKSQRLDPASDEVETVFYWNKDDNISKAMNYYRVPAEGDKPRKASNIAVEEAACAANYLARSQYGMPYENLIVETGKTLGFSRVPKDSDAYKLGKLAVDYCIRKGLLVMDDDLFVKGE